MPLDATIVELAQIPVHPYMQKMMDSGLRERLLPYDAQRVSLAMSRARGGRDCLEVGPGRCDLTTMLSRSKLYERIVAIDIVDRTKYMPKAVEFRAMSVGSLEFEDDAFDTVFCMEVLEHLDDATFDAALSELRRVCRGQLLITVPFLEPMPSKYHQQRFTENRVRDLFPNARKSILLKEPVMRVPWVMMEEDHLTPEA